jgi:hypothetical protein
LFDRPKPTTGCSANGEEKRIGTSTTQLKWWKYVLSRLHVSALAMGHHQVYTNVIRALYRGVIS